MRTGFDLGNTLCESDTEFLKTGDLTLARRIPGAFETVEASVKQNGADNNWIVSTCGVNVQRYSWDWLYEENFFAATGFHDSRYALPRCFDLEEATLRIGESHVLFCEKRPHKAIIADILKLEAFVDDRIKVLQELPDCVQLRIAYRPKAKELEMLDDDRIKVVDSWTEARTLLGLAA